VTAEHPLYQTAAALADARENVTRALASSPWQTRDAVAGLLTQVIETQTELLLTAATHIERREEVA